MHGFQGCNARAVCLHELLIDRSFLINSIMKTISGGVGSQEIFAFLNHFI